MTYLYTQNQLSVPVWNGRETTQTLTVDSLDTNATALTIPADAIGCIVSATDTVSPVYVGVSTTKEEGVALRQTGVPWIFIPFADPSKRPNLYVSTSGTGVNVFVIYFKGS